MRWAGVGKGSRHAGVPLLTCPCPPPPPQVRTVSIPTGAEPSSARLAPLLSTLPLELRPDMEAFIAATYKAGGGWGVALGRRRAMQ